MPTGIGTDVASVADTRRSVERFGETYLRTVFSPPELALCGEGPARIRRLTELFAGKEAVYKALSPPVEIASPWTDIRIDAAAVHLVGGLGHWASTRTPHIHLTCASHGDVAVAFAVVEERETMPESTIREVLAEHARLNADAAGLGRAEDLYAAGMTSHASVNVMLALEEAFDIEFPDELLRRSTFTSIQTIEQAVGGLTGQE